MIHQSLGKRHGLTRHSSSKAVKPSEGDNAIENGMRAEVIRLVERNYPAVDVKAFNDTKGPYGHQGVMTARSAFVARYVTSHDGRYEDPTYQGGLVSEQEIGVDWELYSIVVQSPLLRDLFPWLFEHYHDEIVGYCKMSFTPEHVELMASFKRYLKGVEDALRNEQDPETKQHLSLLCGILKGNLSNQKIKEKAANGIVYFKDIPLMFKPGAILLTTIKGQPQLVSLRECSKNIHAIFDETCVNLKCAYVDWRGPTFGREDIHAELVINEFEGPKKIGDLGVCPLILHPLRLELEDMLISRGKKLEAHKGYHYCAYDGEGFRYLDSIGPSEWHYGTHVEGRFIIDAEAFFDLHPDRMQRTKLFEASDIDKWINHDEMQLRLDCRAAKSLSQEELRLCPPTLRAYSVKDKKWLYILVDDVKDIKWDDQAFKNLALPQEQKEMILSFANSQIRHEQYTGNVVQGKRNGVIVLCGPPGAGQKLTAEAIAEELHAPLYTIAARDLGKTPEEVELFLTTTLEFAAKWKAVLLLDDASAFVKARSYCDGQYKTFVPIYQRILEYYDSVLFLNTNLSGGIDNGFESRVHLSSQYHGPEMYNTQPARVIGGDVEKLVQTPKTYGRVGDVFKEAQILAMEQKTPMSLEHVKTVTQSREADAIWSWGAEDPLKICEKRPRGCPSNVLSSKTKTSGRDCK